MQIVEDMTFQVYCSGFKKEFVMYLVYSVSGNSLRYPSNWTTFYEGKLQYVIRLYVRPNSDRNFNVVSHPILISEK